MQIQSIPLTSASKYSKLVSAYLSGNESVESFHSGIPTLDSLQQSANNRSFKKGHRQVLVDALTRQYKGTQMSGATRHNISALMDETAYTIATGHQLCLFSGPIFSVLKIVSAINLTQQLAQKDPSKTYIPVFWMASEDHDLEEMNHLFIRGQKITWNSSQSGAVGQMETAGIELLIGEIEQAFSPEFGSDIRAWLDHYRDTDITSASRGFFNELFGKYGLVIIDGHDPNLKELFVPVMKDEVQKALAQTHVAQQNAELLDRGFKVQVNAPQSFLFHLDQGKRTRLDREGDSFSLADGSRKWSLEELLNDIEKHPQDWSPNVVGRPLYQETILPNIAYIGGPGELSYWLQLKTLFDAAEVAFPKLILRNSATFLFPGIRKKQEALGLSDEQIFKSKDAILSTLVQDQVPDLEADREGVSAVFATLAAKLSAIDPVLGKSAVTEGQKALKGIENLESKSIRAAKRKNEDLLAKVEAIKTAISPNDVPQERQLNILEAMSVFGTDMIDSMIPNMDPLAQNMWIVTS